MDTIGSWTVDRLARFIAQRLRVDPPKLDTGVTTGTAVIKTKLVVDGDLQLSPQAIAYLADKLGL